MEALTSESISDADQTQYTRSAAKGQSPYPGLRPFTEDESSFFFGRSAQVNQIISHLKSTHVVFVLGGSGSGKSSLIRAGVVSELRGYAIKDAGDHWVPVVVTPGTNLADSQNPLAPVRTPLYRIASRLANSAYFKEKSDPQQVQERTQAIDALLRNSGGFRLVYDRFFECRSPHELNLSPNLLIVLDQFEEIFHPSNVGVADCQRLVERIMEHFDTCHPWVYIVITMRSEHLNDCATYLRLPDIINRTSFLVRRLEPAELEASIVKPGQRKLRILQRQARSKPLTLPSSFTFELSLLQRILEDVEQIKSDPDHLPLLQHLLARLYDTAHARARQEGADFPEKITVEDLKVAINPANSPVVDLERSSNTLRICLEAWAEHVFSMMRKEDGEKIENILRHLAFKDPNSGLYTQQRLLLQDAVSLVDAPSGDEIKKLLTPFLSPLEYLYWDNATPGIITIKVSHESFIRGWNRFRNIIDTEHSVFEDYMHLAKDYQLWKDEGYSNYLSALRLKALERQGISRRILQEYDRRYLSSLVKIKRERPKYCLDYTGISQYIRDSRRHVQESKRRRARIEKTVVSLSIGLVLFVGYVLYDTYFVKPEKLRMVELFDTFPLIRTSQRINQSDYIDLARQHLSIDNLSVAAETLRSECELSRKSCKSYLAVGLDALKITTWVESDINNEARALLGKGVVMRRYNASQQKPFVSTRWNAEETICANKVGASLNGASLNGRLLRGEQGKNIFIDVGNATLLSLYVANVSVAGCALASAEPITTLPVTNPLVAFISKDLNDMVVVTQDTRNALRSNASLNEMNWEYRQGQWSAFSRKRIVIADEDTRYPFDQENGMFSLHVLDRNDSLGSRVMDFGSISVALLNSNRVLPSNYSDSDLWTTLTSGQCQSRAEGKPDVPVVFTATYADFCFHISKPSEDGGRMANNAVTQSNQAALHNYVVSVYRFSLETDEAPVAVAQFPIVSFADHTRVQWMVGKHRNVNGWITSKHDDQWGSTAPWRTETLIDLLKPAQSMPAASLASK